jgi:hypothetical protein
MRSEIDVADRERNDLGDGVIEPTLEAAETRRLADRPTNDLTALDFYLLAVPDLDAFTKESYLRALDLLEQAIGRDPHYGPALALAAHCHSGLEVNGWTADPEAARRKSIDFARRALRSAPDDPNYSRSRLRSSDISARTSMCR